MAATNGKATRATIVKQDKVDQALTFLKELPEKPKEDLSLREAVGHLKDSIKDALTKGYSYADLAKLLTDQGIKISTLTLKNYVPSGKRSASKTRTRRAKKDQGDEASVASSSETPSTSTATEVKKPRRRAKATASPDSNSALDTAPKRSTRGRAKATTVAKAKTGSRTRAKQQTKEAPDSTTQAPTRSRRRKANAKEAS